MSAYYERREGIQLVFSAGPGATAMHKTVGRKKEQVKGGRRKRIVMASPSQNTIFWPEVITKKFIEVAEATEAVCTAFVFGFEDAAAAQIHATHLIFPAQKNELGCAEEIGGVGDREAIQ